MPVDVFPEFAPPRSRSRRSCLGLSAEESRAARDGSARAGARRHRRARDAPLEIGLAAVVDRADLQTGTDLIDARQLVAERSASDRLPVAADLGRAAGHAPAALGHQPGHEDRALSDTVSHDRHVDDRRTGTIRAGCCACPGVANVAIWGERSTCYQVQVDAGQAGSRPTASRSTTVMERPCRDAGLTGSSSSHEQLGHRDGRLRRHAQPAPRGPPRPADRRARGPGQVVVTDRDGQRVLRSRTSRAGQRTTSR